MVALQSGPGPLSPDLLHSVRPSDDAGHDLRLGEDVACRRPCLLRCALLVVRRPKVPAEHVPHESLHPAPFHRAPVSDLLRDGFESHLISGHGCPGLLQVFNHLPHGPRIDREAFLLQRFAHHVHELRRNVHHLVWVHDRLGIDHALLEDADVLQDLAPDSHRDALERLGGGFSNLHRRRSVGELQARQPRPLEHVGAGRGIQLDRGHAFADGDQGSPILRDHEGIHGPAHLLHDAGDHGPALDLHVRLQIRGHVERLGKEHPRLEFSVRRRELHDLAILLKLGVGAEDVPHHDLARDHRARVFREDLRKTQAHDRACVLEESGQRHLEVSERSIGGHADVPLRRSVVVSELPFPGAAQSRHDARHLVAHQFHGPLASDLRKTLGRLALGFRCIRHGLRRNDGFLERLPLLRCGLEDFRPVFTRSHAPKVPIDLRLHVFGLQVHGRLPALEVHDPGRIRERPRDARSRVNDLALNLFGAEVELALQELVLPGPGQEVDLGGVGRNHGVVEFQLALDGQDRQLPCYAVRQIYHFLHGLFIANRNPEPCRHVGTLRKESSNHFVAVPIQKVHALHVHVSLGVGTSGSVERLELLLEACDRSAFRRKIQGHDGVARRHKLPRPVDAPQDLLEDVDVLRGLPHDHVPAIRVLRIRPPLVAVRGDADRSGVGQDQGIHLAPVEVAERLLALALSSRLHLERGDLVGVVHAHGP